MTVTHSNLPRDVNYIARLKRAIRDQYGISATEMTTASRGYYGETWRVSGGGVEYFLKMDCLPFNRERFRGGLSVVDHLCENGVDFACRVVKTLGGRLCFEFDSAVSAMFDWVEGENIETDGTKAEEYRLMCRIYALTKPGLDIPSETFSDGAAARFFSQWDALKSSPQSAADLALLSVLDRFGEEFSHCAARLTHFAARCQSDTGGFYLTHGDAGGNFFAGNGRNYIFDWDEAMYAPVERDAWVMGCYGWARGLFNYTLKAGGIPYELRPERLAFYCYHMYFFISANTWRRTPSATKVAVSPTISKTAG